MRTVQTDILIASYCTIAANEYDTLKSTTTMVLLKLVRLASVCPARHLSQKSDALSSFHLKSGERRRTQAYRKMLLNLLLVLLNLTLCLLVSSAFLSFLAPSLPLFALSSCVRLHSLAPSHSPVNLLPHALASTAPSLTDPGPPTLLWTL
eukprot:747810-Hanusia_phi.AAC.6